MISPAEAPEKAGTEPLEGKEAHFSYYDISSQCAGTVSYYGGRRLSRKRRRRMAFGKAGNPGLGKEKPPGLW
jgi:hypothetical protein